ncbi:MAG: anaerobic ribonucleoside-triphosphate reductase activating protein [Dysgonamonadaceae bacterium]|jgi:anaerobic ribonucleoside-triphosphate reductase activating protein|nr:anaerobic ribonucleoside-triphosphate reductase activating protein [Dysgonamonadaceae bacterium]
MMKFVNFSIVFQEIPGEVTLAINISNCPNRCKGCHSPYLWEDAGTPLEEQALSDLLEKYSDAITCICFMGGDAHPQQVAELAALVRLKTNGKIKTGWYSGKNALPTNAFVQYFDYIKLGAYVESLGGLNCATTNQRFYCIENGIMIDHTHRFRIPPIQAN